MLGLSIDVAELAKIIQELASWHPDAILQKARELSFNPKRAYPYFLVYLRRVSTRRDAEGVVIAINHLFAHCFERTTVDPKELILKGAAKTEGESVVLQDHESAHSRAVVQTEIGDRLFWGIRYRFAIDDGIESKINIADTTFAVCTEDHPAKKSRVFLWDRQRDVFREILQESHLVAKKGCLLLATLFLWDHSVWFIVDDKTVFGIELTGDEREKWRSARPQFRTWRSRRVRIQDVAVFDFQP